MTEEKPCQSGQRISTVILLLNTLPSSQHIFFTATLEVLLRKLDTVEQNQREALILLRANRRGDPGEASVELLQAQTQADLQDLKERLKNRDFTKKMVSVVVYE